MEKVDPKQEIKQEAPKPNKSKVQTEVEKWEERTNLDKREVPKPLVFGPSPKEKAKGEQAPDQQLIKLTSKFIT